MAAAAGGPALSGAARCARRVGRRLHAQERSATCPSGRVDRSSPITRKRIVRLQGEPLENDVLYTIAVILLILWVLGLVTSFTAGGLLHILLVAAVIVVVYQLITGRSVG